ncbi:MAG: DnaJ domain-containing protein [Treponema sp.]|jgi:molecular chaperone DnaJ|nr:DnaJ domain-containing protein [Treponema sp.]
MIQDPYSVLELQNGASMDEVKAAYQKLAKKYHPDLNPGNKMAEEKMRSINAAYEQIKTGETGGVKYERANGTYGHQQRPDQGRHYEDPFGGYGPFADIFAEIFGNGSRQRSYQGTDSDFRAIQQAILYLQNRQYHEAEQILSQVSDKNAQWHYLSAHANAGLGNRVSALNNAREAVRLEPNNPEYRQLLNQFERGGSTYRQTGQSRGYTMRNLGRSLLSILLLQLTCLFCCRFC